MQGEQQINPWLEVPLDDYERHMNHNAVGQLPLLNSLTKKYLMLHKPRVCLFMGVAGGNGLEHIDNRISNQVFGIDINQAYLDSCNQRFKNIINNLNLLNLDLTKTKESICRADFIWAALILEYAGISNCFEFAKNNMTKGGHFIVTIQSNNKLKAVSPSGFDSVMKLGSISEEVDPETLFGIAIKLEFELISKEQNNLPNGKLFLTYDFILA
jgi:hypothetical protein